MRSSPRSTEEGPRPPKTVVWRRYVGAAVALVLFAAIIFVLLPSPVTGDPIEIGLSTNSVSATGGLVLELRDRAGVDSFVSGAFYVARDPGVAGGWRRLQPPAGIPSTGLPLWHPPGSPVVFVSLGVAPHARVPLDLPRPELPTGTIWRVELMVLPRETGMSRIKRFAEQIRGHLQAPKGSRGWPSLLNRTYGTATLVESPDLTMP